ncbi:hypothetical protein EXIGLDRAFT_738470 [Exidia glandulosa HHB12029]|uniref:Uncharacterized protein n=1 Tax=Exidia glandulosa HHB12029 TaxID=1314781 RepID=A0A165PB44_EXIGL|nr:hypothetical protein EXIGLDRAFT_738470 [Exidia glandulosa HHB12029]
MAGARGGQAWRCEFLETRERATKRSAGLCEERASDGSSASAYASGCTGPFRPVLLQQRPPPPVPPPPSSPPESSDLDRIGRVTQHFTQPHAPASPRPQLVLEPSRQAVRSTPRQVYSPRL